MEARVQRLSRKAPPFLVLAAGAAVLALLHVQTSVLRRTTLERRAQLTALGDALAQSADSLGDASSLRDMKVKDLGRLKGELSKLARSRRALYEGGLQLQEERRLLEKQWEIVSTYLLIDPKEKKIHLMRGEQSLESYPAGEVPAGLPAASAIVSKERFAHPERGRSEEVDGQLRWEPPQVGTSARASALGEFVMFTRGPLILHGPPRKEAEHKAFPHACLVLTSAVARRLYNGSFIGTKVAVKASR